jgi:hypothetical protein
MNDVCFSSAILGFNNTRTIFKSKPAYIKADGKEYAFVWSQSIDYRTGYNIEMWCITITQRGSESGGLMLKTFISP